MLTENPDLYRASQRARGADESLIDQLLAADTARRETIATYERLRAEQNAFSKKVGQAKGEERSALLAEVKELAASVKVCSGNL